LRLAVNAFVQSGNHRRDRDVKGFTDSQQGCDRDGSAGFDLLPVAGREAEGDHVFLAVSAGLAKLLGALAEILEEFFCVWHVLSCTWTRAKTPRAD